MAAVAPAGPPEVEERVRRAQAELEQAVRTSGLRGDPLVPVLEALSATVGALRDLRTAPLGEQDMARLVRAARAAALGDLAATERRRTRRLGTLWAALALVCVGITAAAAYYAGAAPRWYAEAQLRLAFRDGSAQAAQWAALMQQNDLQGALAQCTGPRAFVDATGRRVCLLPVFLDTPRSPTTK